MAEHEVDEATASAADSKATPSVRKRATEDLAFAYTSSQRYFPPVNDPSFTTSVVKAVREIVETGTGTWRMNSLAEITRSISLDGSSRSAQAETAHEDNGQPPKTPLRSESEELLTDDQRFAAWYASAYLCRRLRNFRELGLLVEDGRDAFSKYALFQLMDVEALVSVATPSRDTLAKAQSLCIVAVQALDISGSHYQLAEITCELAVQTAPGEERTRLIGMARSELQKARVGLEGYAKYLALEARLDGLEGNFKQALGLIDEAIRNEDANLADYALRVADYQALRIDIQASQSVQRLDELVVEATTGLRHEQNSLKEDMQAELRSARTQVVELVGLIGLIIAFVASAISVSANLRATQAISVFVAISGALVLVFGAFNATFAKNEKFGWGRFLVQLGVGVVLLGLGWWMATGHFT